MNSDVDFYSIILLRFAACSRECKIFEISRNFSWKAQFIFKMQNSPTSPPLHIKTLELDLYVQCPKSKSLEAKEMKPKVNIAKIQNQTSHRRNDKNIAMSNAMTFVQMTSNIAHSDAE